MDNKIVVQSREVYGKRLYYIISSHCKPILGLTGKVTLSLSDIKNLSALGFAVVEKPRDINF